MRNRALHDALRDFALEAAAHLTAEQRAGAEVAFDVVEEPGTGSILYRYRPLTAEFVAERWEALRKLPASRAAARELGSGAETYLRVRGVSEGPDTEPALRAMVERLYEDRSSFEFPEERFERVYAEVERTLFEDATRAAVVAPVLGLELERERVELGDGFVLVPGDRIEAPREAVWPEGPRERETLPNVLCVLERDVPTGAELPVTEARLRFRKLLTALRLFKSGAVALGPLAWGRVDDGAWNAVPLGGGHARGTPWDLSAAETAELRELAAIVSTSRLGGKVAWALSRFEMGCERALDTEALSDYLLALRALLDAGGETGEATLKLRLAALCAEEPERRAVQRRLEAAFSLERWVMGGGGGDAYLDEIGSESPRELVLEVEDHVRALLRDVLCGYLDADLKTAADDILLASSHPLDIEAHDLREYDPPSGEPEPYPEPEPEVEPEPEPVARRRPARSQLMHSPRAGEAPVLEADTAELAAVEPEPPPEPEPPEHDPEAELDPEPELEPVAVAEDAGVTPSADWELDDDPASYSAPI
jgi:hypothetical protein